MRRMIPILDLRTHELRELPSDTPTLDVPRDFDPDAAGVSYDFRQRICYMTALRKATTREAMARPLSWRVRGETCLVAEGSDAPTAETPAKYALSSVHPR